MFEEREKKDTSPVDSESEPREEVTDIKPEPAKTPKLEENEASHDKPAFEHQHQADAPKDEVKQNDPFENGDQSPPSSANTWKFLAVASIILLIVSVFTNGFSFEDSSHIPIDQASAKAIDYINNPANGLLPPGIQAVAVDSAEEDDLYRVSIQVANQEFDSYTTKDGSLLFVQGINLDEAPAQQAEPGAPAVAEVSADDDPFLGPEDADVVVIEFSDYECPFCSAATGDNEDAIRNLKARDPNWEPAIPKLKELAREGKIKYVFRDYPVGNHAHAQKAAEAAECAHDQGKFWEYHDILFANHQNLAVEDLKSYAQDLELNMEQFNECLDNGKHTQEVQKDLADGQAAGVGGTPGYFVNGIQVKGAQSASVFVSLIEDQLQSAQPQEQETVTEDTEQETQMQADQEPEQVEVQEDDANTQQVSIEAKRFRFVPAKITVPLGSTVELSVASTDVDFPFVLEGYDEVLDLTSGETATLTFTANKQGSFVYTCTDCDGKESIMRGTLVVE